MFGVTIMQIIWQWIPDCWRGNRKSAASKRHKTCCGEHAWNR